MTNDEWGEPLSDLPDRHNFKTSGDLIGTLSSVSMRSLNDPNKPGTKKDTQLYVFSRDDGSTVAIWGSAQLDQLLPPHEGHRLKVVRTDEEVDIGGGRKVRQFKVFCATCNAA